MCLGLIINNILEENEMSFINAIEKELNNEKQLTENGAVGYRTTGKELLDLNFNVTSLRNDSVRTIVNKFAKAFFEDNILAIKWLFYARDAREGLGERRLFRIVMKEFARQYPEATKELIPLVPEYGRYDDLWCLLETCVKEDVIKHIKDVLTNDLALVAENDCASISLIGKWLPSENASSKETVGYAKIIRNGLGVSSRNYRKMLSYLRNHLNVVERKMSAKCWNEINYEAVPSRANIVYNNAFLRNDEDRRRMYLNALEKGEAKINSSVNFPHDIVHKYKSIYGVDKALEALWKALPDTVQGCGNTIVVADGSGSMSVKVGNTNVSALEVANSLAIYFAERSSGEFKDKYITFSMRPQLVDLSMGKNLRDKLRIAQNHDEVANTNIEAVFDLILATAINNNMPQEDIPANILIVSDMEFDSCASTNADRSYGWSYSTVRPTKTLFDEIEKKYNSAGYKLPRLVFWNVNSRTSTIPVKENDLGVALVSGFSVNIVKMVMSNKNDPFECLLETINNERYDAVENAVKKHLS
jgi:hypothetical protein